MAMPAAIPGPDWEQIERDFREGDKSIRQIAREHGVSHVAICKRAEASGWTRVVTKQVTTAVTTKRRQRILKRDCVPNVRSPVGFTEHRLAIYPNADGELVLRVYLDDEYQDEEDPCIILKLADVAIVTETMRRVARQIAADIYHQNREEKEPGD